MDIGSFATFTQYAQKSQVFYYYHGEFSTPIVEAAAHSLKARMADEGTAAQKSRKLFSTFIEMAQNVMHYGVQAQTAGGQDVEAKLGAIAVGKANDTQFWIACANLVAYGSIPRISAKLREVQTLSLEEIKRQYKEQLRNDEHAQNDAVSKGAGLGFLTLARDSSEPLEFHFLSDPTRTDNAAYFFIKAVI
jgi:hypothetical protein